MLDLDIRNILFTHHVNEIKRLFPPLSKYLEGGLISATSAIRNYLSYSSNRNLLANFIAEEVGNELCSEEFKRRVQLQEFIYRNRDWQAVWDKMLHYESLALDAFIFEELVPVNILQSSSGDSAYEKLYRIRLLNQAYQLAERGANSSIYSFLTYSFPWYIKHSMALYPVSKILLHWSCKFLDSHCSRNEPQYNDAGEIYEILKIRYYERVRRKILLRQSLNKYRLDDNRLYPYYQFVTRAIEFNELSNVFRGQALAIFCSQVSEQGKARLKKWVEYIQSRGH